MRSSGHTLACITSWLYVCLKSRQLMSYQCSPSALQAGLWPIPETGKRGACSSRREDGISHGKSRQNRIVARCRGILCLADCFESLRPISFAYGCAYARHTPHARRSRLTKIPFRWVGMIVRSWAVSVIVGTSATSHKKIRSKRAGWLIPSQGARQVNRAFVFTSVVECVLVVLW